MQKTETEWAIRNLELAGMMSKDSDYEGAIGESVKELLEVLAKQRHSGHSHAQTLLVFNMVAQGKSLTRQHWQERFDDYNKLAEKNGFVPWTEEAFEKYVSQKPKGDQ